MHLIARIIREPLIGDVVVGMTGDRIDAIGPIAAVIVAIAVETIKWNVFTVAAFV